MQSFVTGVLAVYLDRHRRARAQFLDTMRADRRAPARRDALVNHYLAAEASLALTMLATRPTPDEFFPISAFLHSLCDQLHQYLSSQSQAFGLFPVIEAQIAPDEVLSVRHGLVLRDAALLGMLAALQTFPRYLRVRLAEAGSILELTIEADTPALARRVHPFFGALEQACVDTAVVCWTQDAPAAWKIVCPRGLCDEGMRYV